MNNCSCEGAVEKVAEKKRCDCKMINPDVVKRIEQMMPEKSVFEVMGDFFKVLSDPTRLRILCALSKGCLCVYDIANILDMTQSAVSHQLKQLRHFNIVSVEKNGKTSCYSIKNHNVIEIMSNIRDIF